MKLIEQPGRNLKKDYTSQTNKRERERERGGERFSVWTYGQTYRHNMFFFFFFLINLYT